LDGLAYGKFLKSRYLICASASLFVRDLLIARQIARRGFICTRLYFEWVVEGGEMDHAMGGFNSSYALMYAQTDNTKPTISCHEAVKVAV
jgi:hypothetical protein